MARNIHDQSRRAFMKVAAGGALVLAAGGGSALFNGCGKTGTPGVADSLVLPPLPYPATSLAPHISEKTLAFHHGRHHAKYAAKLGDLVKGTQYADLGLSDIIRKSHKDPKAVDIYNNAAQSFNHAFFWKSMKHGGGGAPTGDIKAAMDKSFGSFEAFRKAFLDAALSQFGSGWVWLVSDAGKLAVVKTANADTPITGPAKPLLCLDVWEHAYYLDYQDRRGDYAAAWFGHLVNWDFAAANLSG